MDATVPTRELQWCSNLSDFVGALNDDTLLPLVRAIDDSPERPDRSRRKSRRLLQSVVFYLYGRYPGTEAPRSVDELYRRLNDPKDALVQLLIFDDRPACPNTMLKWLRNIDDHPDLVEQALRAISDMLPWNPPPKEYPQNQKKRSEAEKPSTRTESVNRYISNREKEALGYTEFEALFHTEAEPDRTSEQERCDDTFLDWGHSGCPQCHKCKPADCTKRHDHSVVPRLRNQQGRRRWQCLRCRSYLSVTTDTLLHSLKLL